MVPQLARVAHPFGVTVMSGGGFDSTTDRHNFAVALAGHDCPTEVLHIGDHDPSGVSRTSRHSPASLAATRPLHGFTGADPHVPAADGTTPGNRQPRLQ